MRIRRVARSTQLGECVAEVLGLRPTTTASHVRNLREAHLLTKTGRGITGAHMTPRDAAHLLIAATCSQDVKDSVETVRRYGKLPHVGNAWRDFPALAALGEQHTFADALATLLDSASIQFLASDPKSTVFVTFDYPNVEARLEVSTHDWERVQEYKLPWPRKSKTTTRAHVGDRHVRYIFSEQTIFTVGNLLRGEG
jgi:hypothetical protein